VVDSGHYIMTKDVLMNTAYDQTVDTHMGYDLHSTLITAIKNKNNHVIGILQAMNKKAPDGLRSKTGFHEDDIKLINLISAQAAVCINTDAEVEHLRFQERFKQSVLDASKAVTSQSTIFDLFKTVIEYASKLVNADQCQMYLVDYNKLEIWSLLPPTGQGMHRMPLGSMDMSACRPNLGGIAGKVVRSGELLNLVDAYNDECFNPIFDQRTGYRTKSMMTVPIVSEAGIVSGVIQLVNKMVHAIEDDTASAKVVSVFSKMDEDVIRMLVPQIDRGVVNVQLTTGIINTQLLLDGIVSSLPTTIITIDNSKGFMLMCSNDKFQHYFPEFDARQATRTSFYMWAGRMESEDLNRSRRLGTSHASAGTRNHQLIRDIENVLDGASSTSCSLYRLQTAGIGPKNNRYMDVKYSVQTLAPGALRGTLAHKYRTEGHLRGATENQQQGVVLILEQVTDENKLDAMLDHRLSTEEKEIFIRQAPCKVLDGTRRNLSILAINVELFTQAAEMYDSRSNTNKGPDNWGFSMEAPPEQVIRFLRDYYRSVKEAVSESAGFVDRISNAEMTCVFGLAELHREAHDNYTHEYNACYAALKMRTKYAHLLLSPLEMYTHVGIHVGPAVVGGVGVNNRMELTCIGDSVKLAQSLQRAAEMYGDPWTIFVTADVYSKVKEHFALREIDTIRLQGSSEPVTIYELVMLKRAPQSQALKKIIENFPTYQRALEAYRCRQFARAAELFQACHRSSSDQVALTMYYRCIKYEKGDGTPDTHWDGSFHIDPFDKRESSFVNQNTILGNSVIVKERT